MEVNSTLLSGSATSTFLERTTVNSQIEQPKKNTIEDTATGSLQAAVRQVEQQTATRSSMFDIFFGPVSEKSPPAATLSVSTTEDGKTNVKTEDGYTVTFSGKLQEWSITSPENKTTRIWGDPHVEESDGDKWDFKDKSTFLFGNNKITVETVDSGNNNTFSKTVTIYNGDDRFTITDLDVNKPKLEAWTFDAKEHDAKLEDGTSYKLVNGGNGWERK